MTFLIFMLVPAWVNCSWPLNTPNFKQRRQCHDDDGYILLADYDFNDKVRCAIRISSNETKRLGSSSCKTIDKITIAPRYAITDNLGAIIEFSDIDLGNDDEDLLAVELTYTF